jgi:hypothetical protein
VPAGNWSDIIIKPPQILPYYHVASTIKEIQRSQKATFVATSHSSLYGMKQGTPSVHISTANAVATRKILINHELSDERKKTIKFEDEWDRFVEAIRIITDLNETVDALTCDEAWENHFKDAIAATYSSEKEFSDALFQALRDSLAEFCSEQQAAPNSKPKSQKPEPILLKGCNVGFDTQVYRSASLGFPDDYGMSTDSMVDHACVVFGDQCTVSNDAMGSSSKKQRISKSRGAGNDDIKKGTTGKRFTDVTAAVELKHIYTSCADHDGRHKLDLRNAHGPIGQALMYTVDTWHCLRRRGQRAQLLPVAVLAGRVTKQTRSEKLCCMQAHLKIPEFLGMPFVLQVDRCIPFLKGKESVQNDKQAIAVYLDTMTTGLFHAHDIAKRLSDSIDLPLSLCCYAPMQHLELLASPIPGAASVEEFEINQGELFRCVDSDVLVKQWVAELGSWSRQNVVDSYCFVDASCSMGNCLVKISFRTVHSTLIPVEECYGALSLLARHVESGDLAERNEGGDVAEQKEGGGLAEQNEGGDHRSKTCGALLAYALISKRCLVTVMEDLSSSFGAIHLTVAQERPWYWRAFCRLVQEVFIPLADINIVHADIRCVPTSSTTGKCRVYNILVSGVGRETELRLIDYDSLVLVTSLETAKLTYAVSPSCLRSITDQSSVEFLFWQVLWMAYVWSPASDDCLDVDLFCKMLFRSDAVSEMSDSEYSAMNSFKTWIGESRLGSLKQSLQDTTRQNISSPCRKAIGDILAILAEVFCPD